MAKIIEIKENYLKFSDGTLIEGDHDQDCCEYNYADFDQLDDIARAYDFNTSKLRFEAVEGSGFRFGDHPYRMFFVPCYSDQNGYYTDELDIYLNGQKQITFNCEERYY